MPEQYTYLAVDFFCLLFPFAFSFYPKINFYKQWRHYVLPCILSAFLFIIWDISFTKAGVWSFNPRYVCGIYLFGLPLEEYLFFVCIPYACVFTYYSLTLFFNFASYYQVGIGLSWLLAFGLILIGASRLELLYTSVTFLSLSVVLMFLILKKATFLPAFYVSFLIILIPFFISNGILTGTGLQEPVVLYNNKYNLGIRMLTIPIEDTFYAMLLLVMNVAGFEFLRARGAMQKSR